MTPKEKAKELVMKFRQFGLSWEECKQCALICVDEIINIIPEFDEVDHHFNSKYWNEVKTEIEKQ